MMTPEPDRIDLRGAPTAALSTFSKSDAHPARIVSTLNEFGVCVIDNFFSPDEIAAIASEYRATLNLKTSQPSPYWTYVESSNQHLVAAVDDLEPDSPVIKAGEACHPSIGLPADWTIQQFIQSSFLKEIAEAYFDGQGYLHPVRVQFVKTLQFEKGSRSQIPFVPHADRQRFLKFFIYLNDMTPEMGPLSVLPVFGQTYREIEHIRQSQFAQGKRWHELNTLVDGNESDFIDITPPINSLVIFDSNLPHMAKHKSAIEDRNVVMIELQTVDEYLKHGKPLWLK